MIFKKITIENFRNFESAELDLKNKNIIFGRNDFGKTNFLYALRFIFDPSIRNKGFEISDYHKKNIERPIKITLEIDISDSCEDNDFIRARVHGATTLSTGSFYIQLEGYFDSSKQIGNPILKWGGDIREFIPITQKGIYSDLDRVFDVVYLDPNLSPKELFDKHRGLLYKDKKTNRNEQIEKAIKDLNEIISKDERVQDISNLLTNKYHDIRKEDIQVRLESEHQVNGIFNHLTPYVQDTSRADENLYPTAGDGRKKILAYALMNVIQEYKLKEKADKRIAVFLIEEIENSLHPSMQQIVSKHLFQTDAKLYPYLFITTHSEHMFTYMDEVNLIRIFKGKESSVENNSTFFKIPPEFKTTRKIYNQTLAYAFFYDRVLLVEGMSEKILFEAILEKLMIEDILNVSIIEESLIMSVEGLGFEDYFEFLTSLGINVIIKTDNDIRKNKNTFSLLGINRCKKLNGIVLNTDVPTESEVYNQLKDDFIDSDEERKKIKREVYKQYEPEIDQWNKNGIYISEIELEEDLEKVLPERIIESTEYNGDFITYLQDAKKKNMNTFVNEKIDVNIARKIFDNQNFSCLKELVKGVD